MLQWLSPVFPRVSIEIDNFLLCLSLERLKKKKSAFLERRNLLLRCSSCAEGIRAAVCWTPRTCQVPSVRSHFILTRPRGAGTTVVSILQVSR